MAKQSEKSAHIIIRSNPFKRNPIDVAASVVQSPSGCNLINRALEPQSARVFEIECIGVLRLAWALASKYLHRRLDRRNSISLISYVETRSARMVWPAPGPARPVTLFTYGAYMKIQFIFDSMNQEVNKTKIVVATTNMVPFYSDEPSPTLFSFLYLFLMHYTFERTRAVCDSVPDTLE